MRLYRKHCKNRPIQFVGQFYHHARLDVKRKETLFFMASQCGISDDELHDMANALASNWTETLNEDQPLNNALFRHMGAVKIDEKLMMSEKVGHRSSYLWGKLLLKCGQIHRVFAVLCSIFIFSF